MRTGNPAPKHPFVTPYRVASLLYFSFGISHDVLTLKKDINNEFDDEAIIALNENNFKCGYVANSVSSVVRGTYSAGRIYDLIKENNTCKVKFIALESNFLIAQL